MMTLPAKACPPTWLINSAFGVLISTRENVEGLAGRFIKEINDGLFTPRNL